MADSFPTASRSLSSRPLLQFLEAYLLRKAAQTPMLTGSSLLEEGCTDTNAYWKLLCLRKAAQTAMLTGSSSAWGRLHRQQCLLEALLLEEGCTDTNAYWKLFCLRKAAQTPMLTGSSLLEEGCTDTNAYWKLLCLRKAAQTAMLTGSSSAWGRLHRQQCLLEALLLEEGCTDTNAYWKLFCLRKAAQTAMLTGSSSAWGRLQRQQCLLENTQNAFSLKKGGTPGWISFCTFCCRDGHYVEISSICLLTSMEQILIPTAAYCICILITRTVWKYSWKKKVIATNIIVLKTHKLSWSAIGQVV